MNKTNGYVPVTPLQELLWALVTHNDALNEAERPPEGHDYNEIYEMFVGKLEELIIEAIGETQSETTDTQISTTQQKAPNYQVGKVLMAIVQRIRLADARALGTALERCWQEQANGNGGSQNRVSDELDMLTQDIAGRMVTSDRQYVETLLLPSQSKQFT